LNKFNPELRNCHYDSVPEHPLYPHLALHTKGNICKASVLSTLLYRFKACPVDMRQEEN